MEKCVVRGTLVTDDGIVPDGEIEIQGSRIVAINKRAFHKEPTFHWKDGWIFPGLVDVHVHGTAGVDVTDGTAESFSILDQALAQLGCTRYLATTMAMPSERLLAVFNAAELFKKADESGLLGIHMEGPFISPEHAGAQGAEYIRNPSLSELQSYCLRFPSLVRRITLAPELPGASSLVGFCLEAGIKVSAGHSHATFEQAMVTFNAGVNQATHLFNAMPPMHHRDPGLVGAALKHPDVTVELIVDGVHLHPATVQLVSRLKGPDRVVLVTDAMRATLLSDGIYDLGGQSVTVQEGVARNANGNLAGSTLILLKAIFQYQEYAGVDLPEAVRAASLIPARMAGLKDIGALQPGYAADFLFVDSNGTNRMTWRNGRVLYDGR